RSWPALREEAAETGEGLLDTGERVRVGEAQIALRVPPEVHPRRHRHVGALEEVEGESEGVRRVAAGIGQHVEGASGWGGHAEPDAAKPRHHDPAALVEDLPEARRLRARLPEGGQRRPLDELVAGDEKVAVQG